MENQVTLIRKFNSSKLNTWVMIWSCMKITLGIFSNGYSYLLDKLKSSFEMENWCKISQNIEHQTNRLSRVDSQGSRKWRFRERLAIPIVDPLFPRSTTSSSRIDNLEDAVATCSRVSLRIPWRIMAIRSNTMREYRNVFLLGNCPMVKSRYFFSNVKLAAMKFLSRWRSSLSVLRYDI